jgi:hypothetical protein
MPNSKYTSFQIKNTSDVPLEIWLKDPEGNSYSVGPLDPGEESIQVAPVGTIWGINFIASEAPPVPKPPVPKAEPGVITGPRKTSHK